MKADKNIALVLLDLVMPEMDGFEVLKYMNQNHLIDEIAVMIFLSIKMIKVLKKPMN